MKEFNFFNALKTTLEIFATSEEANSSSENIGIFLEFEDHKASTVK